MSFLLIPPLTFFIYLMVAGFIWGVGRLLAGPGQATALKSSIYAAGEVSPTHLGVPGYQAFFRGALFFALLHLGALMVGSAAGGGVSSVTGVYLVGLMLALMALTLG